MKFREALRYMSKGITITKNYKLRKDLSIEHNGYTLYRIECIRAFDDIEVGTLGGYVESYNNLKNNAWAYDDAKIYGKAVVCHNAKVFDNAQIYGSAMVYDNAQIYGNAIVSGNARVYGCATVCDNAIIFENAAIFESANVFEGSSIYGCAKIYGKAVVCRNATIFGNAQVYDNAQVCDDARVYDNARIYDNANIFANAVVFGNAIVHGDACVSSNARVCGDELKKESDICYISNRHYDITITPLYIRIGCQYHSQKTWWNFNDKQIEKMDGKNALDFWKIWKEPLKQICKAMKTENNTDKMN